jgi:hypothetical protein
LLKFRYFPVEGLYILTIFVLERLDASAVFMFRSLEVADYLLGVTLDLSPAFIVALPDGVPVTSLCENPDIPLDLGRCLPPFLANIVKLDFIPNANSYMLIFASPSISKRLRTAISSCLVAK